MYNKKRLKIFQQKQVQNKYKKTKTAVTYKGELS